MYIHRPCNRYHTFDIDLFENYNKFMKSLQRYEQVKDYVYTKYTKIYNEPLRQEALTHTAQVDTCITILAMARNQNVEIAKIIALFHDFAQFTQNCSHDEHARLSSILANRYLTETGLFKTKEIDDICYAIAQHGHKEQYDSPYCELIKDADILARFFTDPTMELDHKRKQRLLDACDDIHS